MNTATTLLDALSEQEHLLVQMKGILNLMFNTEEIQGAEMNRVNSSLCAIQSLAEQLDALNAQAQRHAKTASKEINTTANQKANDHFDNGYLALLEGEAIMDCLVWDNHFEEMDQERVTTCLSLAARRLSKAKDEYNKYVDVRIGCSGGGQK